MIKIFTVLLSYFIIIYIAAVIIKKYKKFKKENNFYESKKEEMVSPISSDNNINENNNIDYNKYYRPKRYLITLTELQFYNILLEIAKELELILFSQVSLYNILETKDTYDKNLYFNKIRAKSIDFVLVDKENCRIKLCIELDDYTHNRQDRIERDNFINELFKSLEIDLIRFKVSNYYNKEALKKRIQESIQPHFYTN